jgi:hypothetical protein
MPEKVNASTPAGILIEGGHDFSPASTADECHRLLQRFDLQDLALISPSAHKADVGLEARLQDRYFDRWCPGFDTLQVRTLAHDLGLSGEQTLAREVVLTMLAAPVPMTFKSVAQLESHIRVRVNIARAAAKTSLAFNTEAAERPSEYWQGDSETGFVIRQGVSLENAIIAATQPEVTGRQYEFSCYRAAEYLVLLGLAQEAKLVNPTYLNELEAQCRLAVPRSDPFHTTYVYEYGTPENPIPMRYYVPGDRLWFKNPDDRSSDVKGFEGSWVFYLGGGLFSNFWRRDQPFDLASKCLEIYHWRDGACVNSSGKLSMDESIVEQQVALTRQSPDQLNLVMSKMMAYRDPAGVYANGGCIDSTREIPRALF